MGGHYFVRYLSITLTWHGNPKVQLKGIHTPLKTVS